MTARAVVFLGIIVGCIAVEIGEADAQQLSNPNDLINQLNRQAQERRAPPTPQAQEDLSQWGVPVEKGSSPVLPPPTAAEQQRYREAQERRFQEQQRQYEQQQQALERLYEQQLLSPLPPPMSCITRSLGDGDFSTDCF
jgi:hypothetical protein